MGGRRDRRFIAALPETTLLVLDEAYGETAPARHLPPIDVAQPNVVRMRTFSKAYGLAGIRCGYAVGEAGVIGDFEKIRNHYGVSRMAQIAGLAALADQAYLARGGAKVAAGRDRIAAIARDNGLSPIASATNFVTIDCGRDGAFALTVLKTLWPATSSSASRWCRCSTAASGSASASTTNSTCLPRCCLGRWPPRAGTETRRHRQQSSNGMRLPGESAGRPKHFDALELLGGVHSRIACRKRRSAA